MSRLSITDSPGPSNFSCLCNYYAGIRFLTSSAQRPAYFFTCSTGKVRRKYEAELKKINPFFIILQGVTDLIEFFVHQLNSRKRALERHFAARS